uniref:LamG-like jellyroll fold domain-containing protein n=1 Tax=Candidatus Entotheonella palauensis TaxID=93172 RepID=UPI0015C4787C
MSIPRRSDSALEFEGNINSYAVIESCQTFPANTITVALWLRSSNREKEGAILSYVKSSGASSPRFALLNHRSLTVVLKGESVNTGAAPDDGQWHHVAVRWRRGTGRLLVVVDDQVIADTVVAKGEIISSPGRLILAQGLDDDDGSFDEQQAFEGSIGEVAIWNASHATSLMASHASRPLFANEPNLSILIAKDQEPVDLYQTSWRSVRFPRPDYTIPAALEFEGAAQQHAIIDPVPVFPDRAYTISFWVKLTDASATCTLLQYILPNTPDKLVVSREGQGIQAELIVSSRGHALTTGLMLTSDQWHHVALRWKPEPPDNLIVRVDSDSSEQRFTASLAYMRTMTQAGGRLVLGTGWDVGADAPGDQQTLKGELSPVAIYNAFDPGLLGLWSIDPADPTAPVDHPEQPDVGRHLMLAPNPNHPNLTLLTGPQQGVAQLYDTTWIDADYQPPDIAAPRWVYAPYDRRWALTLRGEADTYARHDGFDTVGLNQFTLAFWIKTEDTNPDGAILTYGVQRNRIALDLEVYNPHALTVGVREQTLETGIDLSDGQWHHVAICRRRVTGQLIIYLDGHAVVDDILAPTKYMKNGGSFFLGQSLEKEGEAFAIAPDTAFIGSVGEIVLLDWIVPEDAMPLLMMRPPQAGEPGTRLLIARYHDLTTHSNTEWEEMRELPDMVPPAYALDFSSANTKGTAHAIVDRITTFPEEGFVLGLWFKSSSPTGTLLSYATARSAETLAIADPGQLRVTIAGETCSTGLAFDDGEWHYLVVRWHHVGELDIWVDGAQGSYQIAQDKRLFRSGTLVLGQRQQAPAEVLTDQPYDGELGHLILYCTPSPEVLGLYGYEPQAESSPEGYYDLPSLDRLMRQQPLQGHPELLLNMSPDLGPAVLHGTNWIVADWSWLTDTEPQWIDADPNRGPWALELSGGVDSYASVDTISAPRGDFTLSFRINTDEAQGTIFSYASGRSHAGRELALVDPENLALIVKGEELPTTISLHDSQWHHIAVTRRFEDGLVRVYRNGQPAFNGSMSPQVGVASPGSVIIGQMQGTAGGDFDAASALRGALAEVAIWDHVRSEAQIGLDASQPLPLDATGLRLLVAGYQNPAILRGASWFRADDLNRMRFEAPAALTFPGTTDAYAIAEDLEAIAPQAITLAFWINAEVGGTGTVLFYETASAGINAELALRDPGNFTLVIGGQSLETHVSLADGDWHHVAVTWESGTTEVISLGTPRVSGEVRLYVDAALRFEASDFRTDYALTAGGILVLGQAQGSPGND